MVAGVCQFSLTGPGGIIRAPFFAVPATPLASSRCVGARWSYADERVATMAHDHNHHTDIDWAEMAPMLEDQAELYTPLYEHAMAWLAKRQTEPGLVVDAGSG